MDPGIKSVETAETEDITLFIVPKLRRALDVAKKDISNGTVLNYTGE